MEKKIRYIFTGVVAVLLIASIVIFATSFAGYIREKNKLARMDERLESLSAEAIDVCNQAIEDWGQADDETKSFVQDYIDNINAAQTPRQKSYIAQSMVAYVAKLVTYSDYYLETDVQSGAIPYPMQSYKWIINRLDKMTMELSAAKDFDNYRSEAASTGTEDTEDTDNTEQTSIDPNGNIIIN